MEQHGEPLDAHAPRIAGEMFGIDAPFAENVGVDHAGAKDFQPACMLADAAAGAFAGNAADVYFEPWFNQGEIGGTVAGLHFLVEQFGEELVHRGEEIGEGDVFVDIKAFDLMEKDVGAGRDVFVAEAASGSDDPDRGRIGLHRMDLDVGGVGAKEERVGRVEIEGVLHIARRMVFGEVEPFEIVVVGVDVGTELDGKPHAYENVENPVESLDDRVDSAGELAAARKGGVEPLVFKTVVLFLGLETGEAMITVGNELFFEIVDELAEMGALIGCAMAELGHQGLDRPFFTEVLDLKIFKVL